VLAAADGDFNMDIAEPDVHQIGRLKTKALVRALVTTSRPVGGDQPHIAADLRVCTSEDHPSPQKVLNSTGNGGFYRSITVSGRERSTIIRVQPLIAECGLTEGGGSLLNPRPATPSSPVAWQPATMGSPDRGPATDPRPKGFGSSHHGSVTTTSQGALALGGLPREG